MKKKIITALTAVMIIASSAVPTMANTVGYNLHSIVLRDSFQVIPEQRMIQSKDII